MNRITWEFIILCALCCLLSPSYAGRRSGSQTKNDCVFNMNHRRGDKSGESYLTLQHPMILTGKKGQRQLVTPEAPGVLKIKNGGKVFLACTGFRNHISGFSEIRETDASCRGGKFILKGKENNPIPVKDLKCARPNEFSIREDVNENFECPPEGNLTRYSIGTAVEGQFLDWINLCRDDKELRVVLTEHLLVPESQFYDPILDSEPRFGMDNALLVDGVRKRCDLCEVYGDGENEGNQHAYYKRMLNRTLGRDGVSKYYDVNKQLYPNRGHLVPRRDFFHPWGMNATSLYANIVPQYASINAGSWEKLGAKLREYVATYNVNLRIYTGAYETLGLKKHKNTREPLWMCDWSDGKGSKKIQKNALPIPRFLWKIALDEESRKGLGFVVSNNPFETDLLDICDPLNVEGRQEIWFPPVKGQDEQRGLVYACAVDDLVRNLDLGTTIRDWESYRLNLNPLRV